MENKDIAEIAASSPHSISEVSEMVDDYNYIFGKDPSKDDPILKHVYSPIYLAGMADFIKRERNRKKVFL